MDPSTPMTRALFRAVAVPGQAEPHNTLFCKIYYPARYSGTALENNTGNLPADRGAAPCPVAILMPGVNVGPEAYGWLATRLAQAGMVTVLYGWIAEEMPGLVTLSPGMDFSALAPDVVGSRPSANALPALLQDLARQNQTGPLAGLLDLDRILLGGHSAGGSCALLNARPDWFPGLRAVFAYAAHSGASTMLGYAPDTLLELPSQLPTLLLAGSEDGVIAASSFRYSGDTASAAGSPDPTGRVLRTFRESIDSQRGDCYLAVIRGANHFSLTWPTDSATGRPFLDWPVTRDDSLIRDDLAQLITLFARAHVAAPAEAATARSAALSTTPSTAQKALMALLQDRERIAAAEVR